MFFFKYYIAPATRMTRFYFVENCILMHPPQNPADALLTEVVTGRMVLLTDSGTVGS